MKVTDTCQPMQRLVTLRELGRLHAFRRRLVEQVCRDGRTMATTDALSNTERQIAVQRSFLYS